MRGRHLNYNFVRKGVFFVLGINFCFSSNYFIAFNVQNWVQTNRAR
jgi:hypothetical protein